MEMATVKQFRTISIPAISSGIFGYPKNENAKAILTAITDYMDENETSIRTIRICIIDNETMNFFTKNF